MRRRSAAKPVRLRARENPVPESRVTRGVGPLDFEGMTPAAPRPGPGKARPVAREGASARIRAGSAGEEPGATACGAKRAQSGVQRAAGVIEAGRIAAGRAGAASSVGAVSFGRLRQGGLRRVEVGIVRPGAALERLALGAGARPAHQLIKALGLLLCSPGAPSNPLGRSARASISPPRVANTQYSSRVRK